VPDEPQHDAPALEPELRRRFDSQRDERIFVELASVCASEVVATTASAIQHAARPHRLRFGIAVRAGDVEGDRLLRARCDDPRISVEFQPAEDDAAGHQWRRHRAQSFYDAEPFTLQVDGGARFAPDWDVRYPELLADADVERPLLTDAPLSRPLAGATASRTPSSSGISARLAAHRFTVGRFAIDVPHDPVERGDDDIRLALRAYSHGYDARFPPAALVIGVDGERVANEIDRRTVAAIAAHLARAPVGERYGLGRHRSVAAVVSLLAAT
jgi:hypothetical protein